MLTTLSLRTATQQGPRTTTFLEGLRTPAWMARAACRGRDTDAWFPTHGPPNANNRRAVYLCRKACPVRDACLSYAMARAAEGDRLMGVWGGLTEQQRYRRLRRQRKANPTSQKRANP